MKPSTLYKALAIIGCTSFLSTNLWCANSPSVGNSDRHSSAEKSHVLNYKRKKTSTLESFKKTKDEKVTQLKSLRDTLLVIKDKVDPKLRDLFVLRLDCLSKWIETIGSYESMDTKVFRSYRFALSEAKEALVLAFPVFKRLNIKAAYPADEIKRIEAEYNGEKAKADKLHGDNSKAFNAMIYSLEKLIEALKAGKDKKDLYPFLGQLVKSSDSYSKTIQSFIKNRIK